MRPSPYGYYCTGFRFALFQRVIWENIFFYFQSYIPLQLAENLFYKEMKQRECLTRVIFYIVLGNSN